MILLDTDGVSRATEPEPDATVRNRLDGQAAETVCRSRVAVAESRFGRGFPTPECYIAAITASRGFAVASRDISAFAAAGIHVIDPRGFGG